MIDTDAKLSFDKYQFANLMNVWKIYFYIQEKLKVVYKYILKFVIFPHNTTHIFLYYTFDMVIFKNIVRTEYSKILQQRFFFFIFGFVSVESSSRSHVMLHHFLYLKSSIYVCMYVGRKQEWYIHTYIEWYIRISEMRERSLRLNLKFK